MHGWGSGWKSGWLEVKAEREEQLLSREAGIPLPLKVVIAWPVGTGGSLLSAPNLLEGLHRVLTWSQCGTGHAPSPSPDSQTPHRPEAPEDRRQQELF